MGRAKENDIKNLNLTKLPYIARLEVVNFYNYMSEKYQHANENLEASEIDKFFDKINIDMSNFKFDREEANAR